MTSHRFVVIAALVLCGGTGRLEAADDGAARASYVTPKTVDGWLQAGTDVLWLDVREPDEFIAGHIPDSVNVRYDQVGSAIDQLPKDRPIVLYCIHSAHRAPEAASALLSRGFTNVHVLEGGIIAWQVEGLPIRSSDMAGSPTILMKTERCEDVAQP
ncbi:MAG: hypothetical protein COV75_07015 [Candidatus Omnitrophica bacterium CG11_big_fil_rev_8_21_14_0_20_63_9]|nr:MAG: hypothetical protein COV75_07015 [Candidatus Omnitrophica bacterium CG11_big_fil_rev_8_21_14_0_20_63_9]